MMANADSLASMSPTDRDLMIRTVIGEAGDDPSAPAVAAVIANRMRQNGQTASQTVLAPGQFEPWAARPAELMGYSPSSPAYQKAAAVVDGITSGATPDPTNGATKFYAPAAQKALGRKPPTWDDGTGVMIGAQKFFGGQPVDPFKEYQTSSSPATSAPVSRPAASPFSEYPTGAQPAPAASAAPSDPFKEYPTAGATTQPAPTQITPPLPGAKPGAGGLVWDERGGHDPGTGELVLTGQPGAYPWLNAGNPAGVSNPSTLAASTGFLGGVPLIGPALESGVQKASAAIHSLQNGQPYADNLAALQQRTALTQAANPGTTTAGAIGGGVVGAAPLMAAAPAAFGVGVANPFTASALSAASSGALGGADAYVRSGGDPYAARQGALFGAVGGGAAPLAGNLIGAGVGRLSDLALGTNSAARNVSGMLEDIGMTPADARGALTRIGPYGMLADIDPAMTTEAGGLAAMGGSPTSILKSAMAARAAQADNRVSQTIESRLGPRPDITAAKEAVYQSAQNAAGPYYNAARTSAAPMDVTPVLADIDDQLKNAVGGEAAVLNKARGYLTDQKVGMPGPDGSPVMMTVPKDDPGALLKVRQALDGDIEGLMRNGTIDGTTAGRSALRAATNIRGQLDDVLKTDPNIEAGDHEFSTQMGVKDAMDEGLEVFTKGTRLPDFAVSLATKTPEEAAAMRQGALGAVWSALDDARRGTLSGAQSMFGKSYANRAKLDALFPNSGDVFDMLNGEAAMRATEQRVAQNSATAERQAVQAKYNPSSALSGGNVVAPLVGEAMAGGPGAIGMSALQHVYQGGRDAITEAARQRLTTGTARGLSALGGLQDQFLDQVGRAYNARGATSALSGGASAGGNLLTRALAPRAAQGLIVPSVLSAGAPQ